MMGHNIFSLKIRKFFFELCPPTRGEREHIVFSLDPVSVGVILSCKHDIS